MTIIVIIIDCMKCMKLFKSCVKSSSQKDEVVWYTSTTEFIRCKVDGWVKVVRDMNILTLFIVVILIFYISARIR